MKAKFLFRIYPKQETPGVDYCVFVYEPQELIPGADGKFLDKVTCTGMLLPTNQKVTYDFQGKWVKDPKYGLQYKVENFTEIVLPGRENIIGYLSSGQIKGIGEKTAVLIYDYFGDKTLDILDNDISRLKEIPGIGEKKLEKITESYLANRSARDIIAFLSPYGITPNKAIKFYKVYKDKTMTTVTEKPYTLCEIKGIGFKIADKIALNIGLDPMSLERRRQAVLFVLQDAQQSGHVCQKLDYILTKSLEVLATETITTSMIDEAIKSLFDDEMIVLYNKSYYLRRNAQVEQELAESILKQLKKDPKYRCINIPEEIEWEEREIGFQLAPEQKAAVIAGLTNSLTVVTGGPGVGKTAIQRVMLDIFHYQYSDADIVCCAPTGKAARRMTEATGYQATTIHKALGLMAGDDEEMKARKKLDGDLIIVDEISMLDVYLANQLFHSLRPGCHLILVGDPDQLPSVGPGAVLNDLLKSSVIPVVKLERVFRQKAGSTIAVNAKQIKYGNCKLEYNDTDFQFIPAGDAATAAPIIVEQYKKAVDEVGLDNVYLLTPLRAKTETGVNNINPVIRDVINPKDPKKPEVVYGTKLFRQGDKVMQMKNFEDVSNGDQGYITRIGKNEDGDTMVIIDFGDNRVKVYDVSQLEMIELAYGLTVHKSQGSEAKTCIINLQMSQFVMLNKPLIYTAITRAKKTVIFVGEKKAITRSILTEELNKRCTNLAQRLLGSSRLDALLED